MYMMRFIQFLTNGEGGSLTQPTSQQDPEAQKLSALSSLSSSSQAPLPLPPSSAAQTGAHAPQYVRTGRGGAGNFAEPPTVSDSQDRQDVVDRTKAAVSASLAGKPKTGLVGRGGAGNWTEDSGATMAEGGGAEGDGDNEEKTRRQQIAAQIAQDIDANLPAPPKTYHQHDRDME